MRRTASKFGARLEPMGLVDAQLHIGRSLDSVTQVESLFSFGADLAGDYPRWTSAQAICETAERLTPEEREPAPAQFQLLVGGLRALAQREHDPGLVLDAYLVRSLAIAGWAASFDACARCGEAGPHRSFSLPGGGALCADCRLPGSATPRPDTLALLGALLSGEWAVADAVRRAFAAGGLRPGGRLPAVAPGASAQVATAGRTRLRRADRWRLPAQPPSCGCSGRFGRRRRPNRARCG